MYAMGMPPEVATGKIACLAIERHEHFVEVRWLWGCAVFVKDTLLVLCACRRVDGDRNVRVVSLNDPKVARTLHAETRFVCRCVL